MTEAGIAASEDNQEEESASTNEKETRGDTKNKTQPGMYTARGQVGQVDHRVAVDEGELLDYLAHNDRAASIAHWAESGAESGEVFDDFSRHMEVPMAPTPPRSDHGDASVLVFSRKD